MRHTVVFLALGVFTALPLLSLTLLAQSPQESDVAVNQRATQLEGELGKFKATAPEAANVMVELADLYHQHGRVLGLIRVAQTFTAAHPADPVSYTHLTLPTKRIV